MGCKVLIKFNIMIIQKIKSHQSLSDNEFNSIYPLSIQALSPRHWTPVEVAKKASQFLCYKDGLKVLDAGSGAGKFCMIGAATQPSCTFYGIDFREKLIHLSNKLKERYNISNVQYIRDNLMNVNFTDYDVVYFFNSFHEKIDDSAVIDYNSKVSYVLYRRYMTNFFLKLCKMPIGTRVVTYHTLDFCVPNSYTKVKTLTDGHLKFYVKVDENDNEIISSRITEQINRYMFSNSTYQ